MTAPETDGIPGRRPLATFAPRPVDPRTVHRLFEFRDAFAHLLVLWVTVAVAGLLPVRALDAPM